MSTRRDQLLDESVYHSGLGHYEFLKQPSPVDQGKKFVQYDKRQVKKFFVVFSPCAGKEDEFSVNSIVNCVQSALRKNLKSYLCGLNADNNSECVAVFVTKCAFYLSEMFELLTSNNSSFTIEKIMSVSNSKKAYDQLGRTLLEIVKNLKIENEEEEEVEEEVEIKKKNKKFIIESSEEDQEEEEKQQEKKKKKRKLTIKSSSSDDNNDENEAKKIKTNVAANNVIDLNNNNINSDDLNDIGIISASDLDKMVDIFVMSNDEFDRIMLAVENDTFEFDPSVFDVVDDNDKL